MQVAISNANSGIVASTSKQLVLAFTPDEEQHFEKWYENNFDIADPQHMHWLKN